MPKRSKYKKTQVEYAADYECSARSIRTYMSKGYPLDDPEKMQAIFAKQKNKPKGGESVLEVDAAALTNEQLENPRHEEEAKLFERILICRKLARVEREARRLVIPKDEIRAGEMRVDAAVKSRLLALPGEMPGRLAGKLEHEIQKLLFEWSYETLTTLSNARSAIYA